MYEMRVLAQADENQWPCAFWAKWCTRSASENLGVEYLGMYVHFFRMVFLALCLSTSLGHLVVVAANDENIEVRKVAPAVDWSALAGEDAGL